MFSKHSPLRCKEILSFSDDWISISMSWSFKNYIKDVDMVVMDEIMETALCMRKNVKK